MTEVTTAIAPVVDNLEICVEALNTERKRSQFIKALMATSVGLASLAAAPMSALASVAKSLPAGDLDILNFALTLEFLERTFYEEAVAQVPFTKPSVRQLAITLRDDETKHTAAISGLISSNGGTTVGRAKYNFGADTFKSQGNFLKLSYMLEDTGVHAYLGQAPNIQTPNILFDAAAIVSVEARHAGAARYELGLSPTITPFDQGFTKDQVLSIAGPLIVH